MQPLLFPGGIPTNTSSEAPTLQARFPPVDSSRSPDLDSQFHSQNSRHHLQASSRTSMRRNSSQSMTESSDNLPIAARFARTLNASQDSGMPALSSSSREPQSHRRNSYSSAQSNTLVNAAHVPSMDEHEVDASGEHGHQQRMKRKSELAHSRPPTSQSRYQNMPSSSKGLPSLSKDQNTSQSSLGKTPNIIRHHLKSLGPPSHNKLHRSDKNIPLSERTAPNIPEPLRVVLNTISDHLAGRHDTLCGLLQERLRLQWPLVRSLSDIWVDQVSSFPCDYRGFF